MTAKTRSCAKCGEKVAKTIRMEVPGKGKSPEICYKCFDKVAEGVGKRAKKTTRR